MGIMITALIQELLQRLNERKTAQQSVSHIASALQSVWPFLFLSLSIHFSYLLLPLKKKQRETGFIECFLCTECYPGRYIEHFTESL